MKNNKVLQVAIYILLISNFCFAANDSTKVRTLKSISAGYYMLNDNDPISNRKSYNSRNRDDHGLTFLYQFHAQATLELFKKTETKIRFENYCGLFTRDMGTISKLYPTDADYQYYEYILKKHPDWDNILLYDQVAITKSLNSLMMTNKTKNIIYGIGLKQTKIDSDENQSGTNIQHWYHKTLNARNFTHKAFTDSNIFKGNTINYFSASWFVGYSKDFELGSIAGFSISPQVGLWYNFTNKFTIVPFSPYAKLNASFNIGKLINGTTRRLTIGYNIYYEPNERLQLFADPGTYGNQNVFVDFNFTGMKGSKIDSCKNWFMMYKLRAFSYHTPLGLKNDNMINYKPSANDKRSLMGLLNFSAVLVLK